MTTTSEPKTSAPTLGWHEFILDGAATTHIAYVYEDGSIYFPEGPEVVTESDFRLASAAGKVFPLGRAAGLLVDTPREAPTEEQIDRAAQAKYPFQHDGYPRPRPDGCWCDECYVTEMQQIAYAEGLAAQRDRLTVTTSDIGGVDLEVSVELTEAGEPSVRIVTREGTSGVFEVVLNDDTELWSGRAPQEPSDAWVDHQLSVEVAAKTGTPAPPVLDPEKVAALLPIPVVSSYVSDWPEDEREFYRNGSDDLSFQQRGEVLDEMRKMKIARTICEAAKRGELT